MATTTLYRRKRPFLFSTAYSSSSFMLLLLLLNLVTIHPFALAPPVSNFPFQRSSISSYRPRPKIAYQRSSVKLLSSLGEDSLSLDDWTEYNIDDDDDDDDDNKEMTGTSSSSFTNWEQEQQEQDLTSERMRERRQMTKRRTPVVGDPQLRVKEKERSVTSILKELAAIQQQGPQKYCMLGTRHCSYLHQQIIELLAYALVLSGNHVYTSGAGGTHAATIRGALRAERPDLLTVVLPQSLSKQPKESQELLHKVKEVVAMPSNDELSLDMASRICNSYLLSQTDQLIAFAFHESTTVIEATKEAKTLDMLVTVLYLD